MKNYATTVVMILVLSLVIWVIFYILTPSAPLNAAETAVLVGFCALVVVSLRWFYHFLFAKDSKNVHKA